ncbi:arabinogalactan endo-1,4-beta-galactosidase [Flavobacterium akiainvivens]|uniref:Arabinogalactan endo-beta-1,4-galactanase n=1 Tax=Flavobacterium akiainvivens TaxID=1202724 RepID=A0A0M8MJD9_9FLAO|nr:arabinogalactan endo-1,4-beta-galactosidase [Flavobacterium akiainvivens]KOS07421.1 arabinogalactan endo-1,4-beta-galactosidase [Flavobacterium akiainvivens]SFQ47944.1 arabinogalactan endo-1,4-beta-galactosidase [Flavobacterium akiainvivens]
MKQIVSILVLVFSFASCKQEKIYLGADLSYVNEIEDCGAYYTDKGKKTDPYVLFKDKGCNLVRVRLWNNPKATPYSNFQDVKKSIKRAKEQKMEVLLDFHYSDTWADPGRQNIPQAWAHITDVKVLGDSVYAYTRNTLMALERDGLLPEMVQVGNETNSEVMQPEGTVKEKIDWKRNAYLLNRGIRAVREVSDELGKNIQVMLHIAQPENALWWFKEAKAAGVKDYDWIGLSYYPIWSEVKFDGLPKAIDSLVKTYNKKLMIVETAYPYSMYNVDKANNILTEKALLEGYPATPQGQKEYMIELVRLTLQGGGSGVIYWEPAWVTSSCKTLWGDGSHWDNATFFDSKNKNEALPAFDFYNKENYKP